jgi:hypothetical protein
MTISPIIFKSHNSRDGLAPNGNSDITVNISSLECSTVSAPPIAMGWLKRRRPCHFAARRWLGVDHAHVACQQSLHPFVAIAVHQCVEVLRPLAVFDHDRIDDPGPDEPGEGGEVGQGGAVGPGLFTAACVEFCRLMPVITTKSERIGH